MANLLAVLLGGILTIAGGFAASIYSQCQRRKALRAAFRAEIETILRMAEIRKHDELYQRALKAFDDAVSQNQPPPQWPQILGADDIPKDPVFDANVGNIGDVGAHFASEIGLFYAGINGIRVDLRVLHSGGFNAYPPATIRSIIAADLALWLETTERGKRLVATL